MGRTRDETLVDDTDVASRGSVLQLIVTILDSDLQRKRLPQAAVQGERLLAEVRKGTLPDLDRTLAERCARAVAALAKATSDDRWRDVHREVCAALGVDPHG